MKLTFQLWDAYLVDELFLIKQETIIPTNIRAFSNKINNSFEIIWNAHNKQGPLHT